MAGTLIKKISAKTVVGTVRPPEKPTSLYTVIGIANGLRTGNTTYGDFVALTGQFEATNLETGEQYTAPQCFLPEPLCGMIAAQLRTTDKEGNRTTMSVRFAVEVGIKPAKSTMGYEYTVRELVDTSEGDPLEDLRQALPAPKDADEKEAKKGSAKK